MNRTITHLMMNEEAFAYKQKIKNAIAMKLGLSSLHAGGHVIRNEKGWRENEKTVRYIWIVDVSRSFVGFGGIFAVQFEESQFRGQQNPAELVQGIFLTDDTGIATIHIEWPSPIPDKIRAFPSLDVFDSGTWLALDGVNYIIHIIAHSVDSIICVNNPSSPSWQAWETAVWETGKYLAERSGNEKMIELFT
ncbi:MAG: hypothetical protein J7621_30575 [Niastella sp.]|nr:hypothetical protein [Niastella sp.]